MNGEKDIIIPLSSESKYLPWTVVLQKGLTSFLLNKKFGEILVHNKKLGKELKQNWELPDR